MVSFMNGWKFSYQLESSGYFRTIVNAFLGFSAAMLEFLVQRILLKNKNKAFSKHYETCGPLLVFQPCNSFLLICIIPLAEVGEHKESLLLF
jgi:hypothetical protein